MKLLLPLAAVASLGLVLAAQSGCSGSSGTPDSGTPGDSGSPPDAAIGSYTYVTLDPNGNDLTFLSMAVGPNDRVGVAYFQATDGGVDAAVLLPDGGIDRTQSLFLRNYDVRYVEWSAGTGLVPSQHVTNATGNVQVQVLAGVSLAFQSNGQPAVAYLGGPDKDLSPYWFQQNPMLNLRQTGGTWTEVQVDSYSPNISPPAWDLPDPVDLNASGNVLGLYPSLAVDATGLIYFAYRDVHTGQFPKQDWAGSDLKIAWGTSAALSGSAGAVYCAGGSSCSGVAFGGNNKNAFGGHIQLAMGLGGQPAVVSDQIFDNGVGAGSNILFNQRASTGTWNPRYDSPSEVVQATSILSATQDAPGPSLAFDDPTVGGIGYGVAYSEPTLGKLSFIQSANGVSWIPPDPVFQSGSGGWYPSLAIDPVLHTPSIAFYFCSASPGVSPQLCPAAQDNIQIAENVGGNWVFTIVDPDGFYTPKLGILSSGKRVLVYQMRDGSLRLAVEN